MDLIIRDKTEEDFNKVRAEVRTVVDGVQFVGITEEMTPEAVASQYLNGMDILLANTLTMNISAKDRYWTILRRAATLVALAESIHPDSLPKSELEPKSEEKAD